MAKSAMGRDPKKTQAKADRKVAQAVKRGSQQAMKTSGQVFNQMGGYYQNFNPNQLFSQMQPQFDQSMQKAGDAIYNEFQRRSAPEFDRQRMQTEQQLIERGLDPQGEAYKYAMDQMAQQQNDARLAAQANAAQAAMAYQNQLFGQAQNAAAMPAQIAGAFQTPMLQYQKFQDDKYLQNMQNQAQMQMARMNRAGRGGGGPDPLEAMLVNETLGAYQNQGQQGGGNPFMNGLASFVANAGSAYANSKFGGK